MFNIFIQVLQLTHQLKVLRCSILSFNIFNYYSFSSKYCISSVQNYKSFWERKKKYPKLWIASKYQCLKLYPCKFITLFFQFIFPI